MGSLVGALKVAARRAGTDIADYRARVAAGEKWCTRCKAWQPRSAFNVDRSRSDGLGASCRRLTGHPRGWAGRPKINPETGRPGRAPNPPRDGDRRQARRRVNVEVRTGRRPHPNSLPCVDCGHAWTAGERRHEYDHHLGYSAEHHYDVEAVCTTCHGKRSSARGEYRRASA